jgi:probable HAF family extracellular repeat protein
MDEFLSDDLRRFGRRREEGSARRWAVARKVVLTLSLALTCQTVFAQAMYRIKPLGYLGGCSTSEPTVSGLNDADEVAGYACNANGDTHAYLWKNNGMPMLDLGPTEVGSFSDGTGINASGQVVANAQDSTGSYAFVSSGDGTPITKIHNALGGSDITTTAINDLGQFTGYATDGGGTWHAFMWKNDGSPMVDVGVGFGYAINASGEVAGDSYQPFIWKNDGTPLVVLGTLGGKACCVVGINASGQIAGQSQRSGPKSAWRAFLWRNDGTPVHDIGTLGGPGASANALNDAGQITGSATLHAPKNSHAFFWKNDGTSMVDIGTLGGPVSIGNDVNSSGQVAGQSEYSGGGCCHAFLWRNDGTKIQDLNTLDDPTDPLKPYITLMSGKFINNLGDIVAEGFDSRTAKSSLYLLQGTVLTLTPRSLAFGNQAIKTSSAAKSVTVTNTSAKVVPITNIVLTGAASGQFASTNNCGKTMAGHVTCTINVKFKPTTKGAKSATLNVNGGGNGLRSVTLTGTGT